MKEIIIACVVVALVVAAVVAVLIWAKIKSVVDRKNTQQSQAAPASVGSEQPAPVIGDGKPTAAQPAESGEEPQTARFAPVADESSRPGSLTPESEAPAESSAADGEEVIYADDEDTAVAIEEGKPRRILVRYNRSFQARLIQSPDETKRYYSELKNALSVYPVKSRMSWKWESFRKGRKTLAKLRLRGKSLSVALALDPELYADTKYKVESVAEVTSYADTPCLYRIKNDRRVKYAKQLIDALMQNNGLSAKQNAAAVDYAAQYPYETTETLLGRKLVKEQAGAAAPKPRTLKRSEIRKSVQATDVDKILGDEAAVSLMENLGGVSDRTKTAIVNIDTLAKVFADGEKVTLPEIRKRLSGYGKVTYIKVLARGTLDKKLTVEADDFSIQAVKMIVLVGGKAIKK